MVRIRGFRRETRGVPMRMTEPAMRNGGECEKKLDGAGKIAGTGNS